MTVAADQIGGARAVAEVELEALLESRGELAFDAIAGDVRARAAVEGIDMDIASVRSRLGLCDLAEEQAVARARAAQEAAEADERQRLEDETVRLEQELAEAVDQMQRSAIETGKAAATAVDLGNQLASVKSSLGLHHGRPCGPMFGELLQVRLRDQCGVLVFDRRVSNAERLGLLEAYPIIEADDATTMSRSCSVCSHEALGEIQVALDSGESLRGLEERYGVSRSSLSRHKSHAHN